MRYPVNSYWVWGPTNNPSNNKDQIVIVPSRNVRYFVGDPSTTLRWREEDDTLTGEGDSANEWLRLPFQHDLRKLLWLITDNNFKGLHENVVWECRITQVLSFILYIEYPLQLQLLCCTNNGITNWSLKVVDARRRDTSEGSGNKRQHVINKDNKKNCLTQDVN